MCLPGDDGGHQHSEKGHKPRVLIPSPGKIYTLSLSLPSSLSMNIPSLLQERPDAQTCSFNSSKSTQSDI